jgi:hypothetical protein
MYDIVYKLNEESTDFNEMKVLTGTGLKRRSKERSSKKLSDIYYNPKQGYSGINDLVRK